MKRLINKIKRRKVSRVQRERELWDQYILKQQEMTLRSFETIFEYHQLELPVQLKDMTERLRMKDGFEIVVTMVTQLESRVNELENNIRDLVGCIEVMNEANKGIVEVLKHHQQTIDDLTKLRQQDSIGNERNE